MPLKTGIPRPSGLGGCQMTDSFAALEVEIERAWVLIGQLRKPCAVRLTRAWRLVGLTPSNRSADGDEVGTYTSSISLSAFREDVFHVFEEIQRGNSI